MEHEYHEQLPPYSLHIFISVYFASVHWQNKQIHWIRIQNRWIVWTSGDVVPICMRVVTIQSTANHKLFKPTENIHIVCINIAFGSKTFWASTLYVNISIWIGLKSGLSFQFNRASIGCLPQLDWCWCWWCAYERCNITHRAPCAPFTSKHALRQGRE